MTPKEAQQAYDREWPDFNRIKEIAVRSGNQKSEKRARQMLSALSVKYSDRHIIPDQPPTIEERLIDLEERVMLLEKPNV